MEAKLTFMLRNKDELLTRIEALEREGDKSSMEITLKLQDFERKLKNDVEGANSKLDRLIAVIARLEEDVRVQVDKQIRELEQTDLRQQKEIADLNDQIKLSFQKYESLRETIQHELQAEFEKVNKNFNVLEQ